jgi:hypothetical protein
MNKVELTKLLNVQLSSPQSSERWAMYRIIAPIVDYANTSLKLLPYFEFNQTSEHGTHQSVDIALLDQNFLPRILVEAKRWDRVITPEQIDKYLEDGLRGVVSNGIQWVLCERSMHTCVTIFVDGSLQLKALDAVIKFLRGQTLGGLQFKSAPEGYRNTIKPWAIKKHHKAVRKVHPKAILTSSNKFRVFIDSLDKSPAIERALLVAINETLESSGMPSFLRIEARKTRVSLFDDRRLKQTQRIARLELGKKHPDVLVLTEMVEKITELAAVAKPFIHDKGEHMRRFRIKDEDAAMKFGRYLILGVSENQN